MVRVAAPIYLKFGLRNSPPLYPAGQHLESLVLALSRERVRRAAIGLGDPAAICAGGGRVARVRSVATVA